MSPVNGCKSTAPSPPPRLSASSTTASKRIKLEELLELHRLAHVAFHLELAGHVGGGRVLLAAGDLHESLRRGGDRAIGVAAVLADGDLAVVDVDGPGACTVDLEAVGGGQAACLRGVHPCLEALEELSRALDHAAEQPTPRHRLRCRRQDARALPARPSEMAGRSIPDIDESISATGSAATRRRARGDGSSAAKTRPATGAAAAAYIALRRSIVSAIAPRPTAATPPRPIERPIDRPEAIPIRRGRYSWLITMVTPKVPITQTPTSASATAPRTPPTRMYASARGPTASMLATSTGRRPRRSAIGPAASVPSPPARSISESRGLPCDFEWPRETSQSGTKVISPNQATLRKAITPSSSASAPGWSSPLR